MFTGLLLILLGVIAIFLPKTSWYLKVTENMSSDEGEEFLNYFRIVTGLLFLFLGALAVYSHYF